MPIWYQDDAKAPLSARLLDLLSAATLDDAKTLLNQALPSAADGNESSELRAVYMSIEAIELSLDDESASSISALHAMLREEIDELRSGGLYSYVAMA